MARRMLLFLLLIPLMLLSTTSCWDRLEIEDQAFIIGVAVDQAEDPDKITVTFKIAQPQAFIAESQVAEPFFNIKETAEDVTAARNQLARGINWIPTMEHCQVILVGEELAREGLKKHMDFALRTHEVRRRLQIGVVQGKAGDILDMKFKSDLVPSFVISEMMNQNSQYTFSLTDYMSIGSLHVASVENYDFILSRIIPIGEKLDMSGGAVFRNFHLSGWLSGEELIGARFLRGDVSSGYLTVDLPPDLGDKVMLRVFESQSELRPEIRDDKLYAILDLRLEGDINEIVNPRAKLTDSEFISQCRALFENYVKTIITNTFHKVQREYESDPFRLKEKLESYYPEFWKENADNWDEIYQSAELEIEGEVRIRRIGEIKSR